MYRYLWLGQFLSCTRRKTTGKALARASMKSCDAMVGLSRAKFVPIIIYTTVVESGQNFNQKLDLVFVSVFSDILISSECNIVGVMFRLWQFYCELKMDLVV